MKFFHDMFSDCNIKRYQDALLNQTNLPDEGRDQDEVSTGRRVATATVESGVPKHFSSDNGNPVTWMAQSGQSRTQRAERVWALGSATIVCTVVYVQPSVNP